MKHEEFKLPSSSIEFDHTCTKCGHLPVCMIFRAFSPLIHKEFQDKAPIEPENLGKICKCFISAETLRALEEGM